jgi:glycosyltransferase involved in cell wall biosynthesis
MHLHSVIISYNRLELLKECYHSYKETVSVPYTLTIVDNRSDNETRQWLSAEVSPRDQVIFLEHNRFPGYACNRGWEVMPSQTTHLHRSDNDFSYLPGWCDHVIERFRDVHIGQVGLRTNREELNAITNVGGNNVIRRALWDDGLRYDERPWGEEYPKGWTEDSLFSPAVIEMGWKWTRVRKPCIVSLSREDPSDPYYQETWRLRGIDPPSEEA